MEPVPTEAADAFGLTLKALRKKKNLSLRELGQLSLYSYSRLSRAENGEILIPEEKARALDGILGAGGTLITLWQAASAAGDPASPGEACNVAEGDPVTLEIRMPGGGSITVTLSRRQFTQILATGAVAAAFPSAGDPDSADRVRKTLEQPARIDSEVIDCFRRTLDEFYKQDKMLGSGRLISTVLAQINVLDGLRPAARPPYADPLFQVMAQHAEMVAFSSAEPVFA